MKALVTAILLAILAMVTSTPAFAAEKFKLIVSVDWEGEEVTEKNIRAIETFRAEHPEVKLVHFLNAAYYTAPDADAAAITALTRRVIKPGDEIGLHIHGWKDLFEKAFVAKGLTGSSYINSGAFWGGESKPLGGRVGHDIPIEYYSTEELEAVIAFSIEILRQNGFTEPITSFRAGGWQAGPKVLAALDRSGFAIDSSAIAPEYLQDRIGHTPLFEKVNGYWGPYGYNIRPESRPFKLPGSRVNEIPGQLFADYVSDNRIRPYVNALLAEARRNPSSEPPMIHLAFHAETAYSFIDRISSMLDILNNEYLQKNLLQLTYGTLNN